jgi:hypothetical protein
MLVPYIFQTYNEVSAIGLINLPDKAQLMKLAGQPEIAG